MRLDKASAPVGDRVGDPHLAMAGITKPPVLGRRTLRALCVVSLAIIIYGTLGPLRSGPGPWIVAVEHWHWLPPITSSTLDDVVLNLAVYVPVGVALRLLVRRRGQAGWRDFSLGLSLSIALSYTTELLEQALPGRVSSLTDVLVDGVGALLGCLLAPAVQGGLRRVHAFLFVQARGPQRLWAILAVLCLLVTAIIMTAEWTYVVRPRVETGWGEPFGTLHVQRIAAFTAIGFFSAGALLARGRRRWTTALIVAWTLGAIAALVLECVQVLLHEHLCSVLHALESMVGVSAGCAAAALLARPGAEDDHSPTMVRWLQGAAVVALVVVAVGVAGAGVWRELLGGHFSGEPAVDWAPFRSLFHGTFNAMFCQVLQEMAVYSLVTVLCLSLALDRGQAVSLLLLLAVVIARECARSVVIGHHAGTTSVVLAVAAWLVTTRVCASIRPGGRAVCELA